MKRKPNDLLKKCNQLALLAFVLFSACNSPFTVKKDGYFKIDFPERDYQTFSEPGYPYSFEYPTYAFIARDSAYFQESNSYWVNVVFPQFHAKIFISYKNIGGTSVYKVQNQDGGYRDSTGKNEFDNLVKDAYELTYKNDIKAYSIGDSLMHTPNGISGIYFNLSGNVATAHQFFLSDTTRHFIRGALYFNTTPNEDSLRPVTEFLQQDMKHLINTLEWK